MNDKEKQQDKPEHDRPLVDYSKKNQSSPVRDAVKDFKDSSGLFHRREIDKEK